MGVWSPAFYSDDLTLDIRGDYGRLLQIGREADAEKLIIEYYYKRLKDSREELSLFWIALAVSEWKRGRLSDMVLKRAVEELDSGVDLERFRDPRRPNLVLQRKKVLDGIRKMILSPQPSPKKASIKKGTHSPWPEGSLLAYKICLSDDLLSHPLFGKYALIRVAKVERDPISKILPSEAYNENLYLSLYGWIGDSIPEPSIMQELSLIPFYTRKTTSLVDRIRWEGIKGSEKDSAGALRGNIPNQFEEYCTIITYYDYREMQKAITPVISNPIVTEETIPAIYTQITTCTIVSPNIFEHRLVDLLMPFARESTT